MMNKAYASVIVVAYGAPLLAWALPRMAAGIVKSCRAKDGAAPLFVLLAVSAAFYAFPSSASKSGDTNLPPVSPSSPAGRIRLLHADGTGRLVPLDARIREVQP